MKIITTFLIGGLALLIFNSPVLAQGNSGTFILNQPALQLNLEQKDFETIYRTDQLPDTCYRSEVHGTRTECHTEYDRICNTRYERQCHIESYPVCHTVPRNVCHPSQVCTTQMDRVCNTHGCTNVPRRSCHTVNSCSTQQDRVCHTESRDICSNIPREYCENIPRQACEQVPNVVQVPYACTRPVQVPIGQQLKLHTAAKVDIQFANFNEVGAINDVLVASLADGVVTLSKQATTSSAFLFQIIDQQRSEQALSVTEKVVNYRFVIKAISIQKLNTFLSSQLVNGKLYMDRLSFTLLGAMDVAFKGHLKLVKIRHMLSDIVIIDQDFASNVLMNQGNISTIRLASFGINGLEYKNYSIELSLSLDMAALQAGLINAGDLSAVLNKTVQANFISYPN